MGSHDKWGGYTIDWNLVRTYVVPSGLDTFKVRLFFFFNQTVLFFSLSLSLTDYYKNKAKAFCDKQHPPTVWNGILPRVRKGWPKESEIVFGQVEAGEWNGLRCL